MREYATDGSPFSTALVLALEPVGLMLGIFFFADVCQLLKEAKTSNAVVSTLLSSLTNISMFSDYK